ncbi:MAG: MFS transporter [Candidatus Eutrophobiaceae bacterium]
MKPQFLARGFLPYVAVVYINAFVDLGNKIIIQNTIFKTYDGSEQLILTAAVNALILLPFIMFFTPAGYCSDKYPKNSVMKISAAFVVFAALLITLFYYLGWFWPAFAMTFLLALQSAFYSPAKYGFIREMVSDGRLAAANGVVQAVTIIAILSSTVFFSVLFEGFLQDRVWVDENDLLKHVAVLGWVLVVFAVVEFWLACHIPKLRDTDRSSKFIWQRYVNGIYLRENLHTIFSSKKILLSILGLSLFWSVAQVLIASFPTFAKESMQIDNTVYIQGLIACSGIGIMLGSFVAVYLSREGIETRFVPISCMGISLCLMLMLVLDSLVLHGLNFLVWGVFGGLLVVPLNSLIQYYSPRQELGKVLAGNNLLQNFFMFTGLALTVVAGWHGIESVSIFLCLLAISLLCAIYALCNWRKVVGDLPVGAPSAED